MNEQIARISGFVEGMLKISNLTDGQKEYIRGACRIAYLDGYEAGLEKSKKIFMGAAK